MPMTFGNDWTFDWRKESERESSLCVCLDDVIDSVCANDYFINTSIKNQLDSIHACFSMIMMKKNNNSE